MGCTNKTRSNAPRVRIGTDTIFSVALYRHDGELGTSPDPNMEDIIDPNDLASIEAEVRTEFGSTEGVDVNIDGKLIKLEVTKEMTERLGLGCYKVRFQVRELDSRFSDGYRDVTLLSELCRVVPDGADAGLSHGNISVVVANLAEGKSAYDVYLSTTTDDPKLSESDWLESLKGFSAYQIYLQTTSDSPRKSLPEWMDSLKGEKGDSAYQDYLKTTSDEPKKTLPEWLASLKGDKGDSAYDIYVATTSDSPKKSREEWLSSLDGVDGKSAYQSYLDTTKDEPKMTEEEWASNGWLIMLETLKKLRGTKR